MRFHHIMLVTSCGWFMLGFNTFRKIVFVPNIYVSPLCSRMDLVLALSCSIFSSFSIMVNFACVLKLWFSFLKCLSYGGPSGLHILFLWSFIRLLSCYLDLSMYCAFSQRVHSIRYMTKIVLQLTLW